MHIALLTWDFPPRPTGLGRAAYEIAASVRAAGCDVTVFDLSVPYGSSTRYDDLAIVGAGARDAGFPFVLRQTMALGHHVAPHYAAKAVAEVHRTKPFDLVEATNWYAPGFALREGPVPLIVRNSTPAIDAADPHAGLRDRMDLNHAHRLEKMTANSAAGMISNTDTHRELIENLYTPPPHQPHDVIGLALSPETIEAGLAAMAPDLTAGAVPNILFVGRAERRKGFVEAVDGFALACDELSKAGLALPELTIVGVDADRLSKTLASQSPVSKHRDRITTVTSIDDAKLHALYEAASIVLAPSRYESYGLVYREAAAFGRPLLACGEDPSATSFIGRTGAGVLAPSCTPHAISQALLNLLADTEAQARYRHAGLAHAQTLTRSALGGATCAFYDRMMAAKQG